MPARLLLVGAGHAHLDLLAHLGRLIDRGHRVTVVSAAEHHYYSGMGPGLLSGIYRPEQVRFQVRRMVEAHGGRFVTGRVERIEPAQRAVVLEDGGRLSYDVVSFNVGSTVPRGRPPCEGPDVFTVKPIEGLLALRRRVLAHAGPNPLEAAVVGGGPSGVEVAGNLQRVAAGRGVVRLVTGGGLLPGFGERLRRAAGRSLRRQGVEIIDGVKAAGCEPGALVLEDGRRLSCRVVVLAVGIRPPPLFAASGLPTGDDGGLLVDRFLRSVARPEIFGGGDCICFAPRPLAKVGVYAVRQGPVLRRNLLAALEDGRPAPFAPQADFLQALNMGDGTAVLRWRGLVLGGRLAFAVKDWIDRRFMKRYRVSEGACA